MTNTLYCGVLFLLCAVIPTVNANNADFNNMAGSVADMYILNSN